MNKITISPENNQRIYFTSDLHLLHKNVSGPERSSWTDGYRDFQDEYKMTDYLVNSINEVVAQDDILFNLGDFGFQDHKRIPEMRQRIVCQNLYHVLGNHDSHIPKYQDQFTSVDSLVHLEVRMDKKIYNFILCHYAMRVWLGNHKGFYHLYGHSHASLEHTPWGKSMDVGVDSYKRWTGDYKPFSIEEVISILDKREVKTIDHHPSLDKVLNSIK
jgi:calcineurin-like phosphoesterase family protein